MADAEFERRASQGNLQIKTETSDCTSTSTYQSACIGGSKQRRLFDWQRDRSNQRPIDPQPNDGRHLIQTCSEEDDIYQSQEYYTHGTSDEKAEKKAPPKPTGKFKSAEFVHDSDDDTDIPDAPPLPSSPPAAKKPAATSSTATKKSTEAKKAPAKPAPDSKPAKTTSKPASAAQSPTVKPQITLKPQPRTIKTIPANNAHGTGSKTLPGSRPAKPTSPVKPSPLASSPPTNASDIDNSSQNSGQTSSSSSSPLMAQMAKQNKAKPAATTIAKPKVPAKPNGTAKPVVEQTNPLKRKALPEPMPTGRLNRNGDDIKRRRPIESMSPSGTSSGSASPPHNREHLRQQLRQKSMDFKRLYSRYRDLHNSLVNQMDPTPSDLSRLKQMHARVQRMKKEIWDEDRRLRG